VPPIVDKGDNLSMTGTRKTLLDCLQITQRASEEGHIADGELTLLGVRPHWAMAFFEHNKDCENKSTTKPWPYTKHRKCLREDNLKWIGVVASASRTSLKDEKELALFAQVEAPQKLRTYRCKNHLIWVLLMGPPTLASKASKWAIHAELIKCAEPKEEFYPGFKLNKFDQWAVHRAIRLRQTMSGFDAPLGLPSAMRLQPDAVLKVKALQNKIRRAGESFYTM
jgi:hypothetical protein